MSDPNKPSDENEDGDWQERSQQREGSQQATSGQTEADQQLLASLSAVSREAVDGVRQGMQHFRQPAFGTAAGKKKTSGYAQESYAERGEEMRRHAGLHSAVVDHDALTNAEGGLPPIPGAKVDPSALVAPKTRRTTTASRKGRDR